MGNRDNLGIVKQFFVTLINTVLVTVLTRVTKFILWANEKVFLELSAVTHLNRTYESTSNQILNKVSIFNLHTCIKFDR